MEAQMEIRNYLRVVWEHIWWLIVPTVVIIIVTLIFTYIYLRSYYAPVSFSVNRISQGGVEDEYQYDGYYALEANRMLGVQFASWLRNGALITDIYSRAGLEPKSTFLTKEWRVIQRSNTSEYRFSGRDKGRLEKLAKAAISAVSDHKVNFEGTGKDKITTVTVPEDFLIGTTKLSVTKNLLSALGIGIVIGLVFVYLKEIFSRPEERS